MAEVHIIGQIESAFDFPDSRLCCRWNLQLGGGWRVIAGDRDGQTQTDLPSLHDRAYFCHPIDLHLTTQTIQGWPKLQLQIWHHDQFGRQELYAYGTVFVPVAPGDHEIHCNTWRPMGGFREETMQKFLGGGMQLGSLTSLENPLHRAKLRTMTMGTVVLRLAIITRHFDKFGILC